MVSAPFSIFTGLVPSDEDDCVFIYFTFLHFAVDGKGSQPNLDANALLAYHATYL